MPKTTHGSTHPRDAHPYGFFVPADSYKGRQRSFLRPKESFSTIEVRRQRIWTFRVVSSIPGHHRTQIENVATNGESAFRFTDHPVISNKGRR